MRPARCFIAHDRSRGLRRLPGRFDPFETPERLALAESVRRFTTAHIVAAAGRMGGRRGAAARPAPPGRCSRPARHRLPRIESGRRGRRCDRPVGRDRSPAPPAAAAGSSPGLFTHGIALPHIVDDVAARRERRRRRRCRRLVERYVRPCCGARRSAPWRSPSPTAGRTWRTCARPALAATARPAVTGSKTYITSGARADFVVAAVRTGGPGAAGHQPGHHRRGRARLHRDQTAGEDGLALQRHRGTGLHEVPVPAERTSWAKGRLRLARPPLRHRAALAGRHRVRHRAALPGPGGRVGEGPHDVRSAAGAAAGGPPHPGGDASPASTWPAATPDGSPPATPPASR